MNNKLITNLENKFKANNKFESFPDFITDIHFPCFKGLEKDSVLHFNFPLTVLVGENGCGKTSILQALEKTREGNAFTSRWFSTKVDPIPENPRPAFWYSYYSKEANQIVEILNSRIKTKNPDYWEPSRPVVKYGMKKFEENQGNVPGATKTRWTGTKREILYLDFRAELSAFDKYFYFEDQPNTQTLRTKQDYIRYYSRYLRYAIEGIIHAGFTLRSKKVLNSVTTLTDEEVKQVSSILDKDYKEIKIITHRFYKKWGDSVYFKLNQSSKTFTGNYTEAFAGSGESAVVKLVHKVTTSSKGTLILLDEPEVSLHPGAQKKLLNFLLEQTLYKGLKIVLTSHSPEIVEELPEQAITLLSNNGNGAFAIRENTPAQLAFEYIGHITTDHIRILVEDAAAKELIDKILSLMDAKANDIVDVNYHNGGAEDLLKEAVVFARNDNKNIFIILDGDMKKVDFVKSANIPDSELDKFIQDETGITSDKFSFTADSGKEEGQLREEKKKYLDYLYTNVFFFPTNTPEEIMWEASNEKDNPLFSNPNYKMRIKDWAEAEIDAVDNNIISTYRKRLLKMMDKDDPNVKTVMKTLRTILAKSF